jgi:hypothetical protein
MASNCEESPNKHCGRPCAGIRLWEEGNRLRQALLYGRWTVYAPLGFPNSISNSQMGSRTLGLPVGSPTAHQLSPDALPTVCRTPVPLVSEHPECPFFSGSGVPQTLDGHCHLSVPVIERTSLASTAPKPASAISSCTAHLSWHSPSHQATQHPGSLMLHVSSITLSVIHQGAHA